MTDKQEQALATSDEQQGKPELAQENEQAQAAPEQSLADQLREAMASGFIQHCVNGRVVECKEAGANPVMVGSVDAVSTLLGQVINAGGPEGVEQQMNAVMNALSLLSVNGAPLTQHIVRGVVMQAAAQGSAFVMLGELQGLAIESMTREAMNSVYAACMEKVGGAGEAAPSPMKPFPAGAEAGPAADHEQHIEEGVAAAVAKAEAGDANYTSAEEAKGVMDKRKQVVRQKAQNTNKRRPRHRR